ncbi:MAG TPA: hypothetical protein VK470_01545 [Bacteroidota bacterium]|nr:hypothetical protein [Bacteroidota bacterium]
MLKFIGYCGLIVAIACTGIGCSDQGVEPSSQRSNFTQLFVTRDGGGNIYYYVAPVPGYSALEFTVTRINYRDTNYTYSLGIKDCGRMANYVRSILAEEVPLKGDYRPATIPTGTWVRYHVVDSNGTLVEITNTDVRDTLGRYLSMVMPESQ